MNRNLDNLTLSELHKNIKVHAMSSCDVLSFYIENIIKNNPKINAIFHVDVENLFQQAKRYDALSRKGKIIGPLHGVPITVKDNITTKGMVTSAGIKKFRNKVSSNDATVVKKLKSAGAIILGKTNTPDLTLSWSTESTAYGVTRNPHNYLFDPGGSSGGEAASIASKCSPAGIGNDCGGSIRLPSHYCGVAGLRPSRGLISCAGLAPPLAGTIPCAIAGLMTVMGPLARTANDLDYMLDILKGPDDIDPNVIDAPLNNFPESSLRNFRIGYYTNDGIHSSDKQTTVLIESVVSELKLICKAVDQIELPLLKNAWQLFFDIFSCEEGRGNRQFLEENSIKEIANHLQHLFKRFKGHGKTIDEFLRIWTALDVFRSEMQNLTKNYDLLITYVMPHPATAINDALTNPDADITRVNNLVAYSLLGWPVVVIKVGVSELGLPIGIQIIAKHWNDKKALLLAKVIERDLIINSVSLHCLTK